MTGLLRAEVRRLLSRRLFRILALVFLGLMLLVQVVGAVKSREESAMERAANAEAQHFCAEAQQRGELAPGESCDDFVPYHPRYETRRALPGAVAAVSGATIVLAFVAGASGVGADWSAGTMQALLFWEPRRGRVILAKAAALVGVVVAFAVAAQALAFGTTFLVAAARGTNDGATSGFVISQALGAGRGVLVAVFLGLLGFAIAGLARHTGAALGASFVYLVGEQVIGSVFVGWNRYLLTRTIAAALANGIDVPAGPPPRGSQESFESLVFHLTGPRGALTLAVYVLIAVGAFYLVFDRRDVT
ncbi:MAG TPA: hypothetical protein VF519_11220 [Mycobacteriales bacterium]